MHRPFRLKRRPVGSLAPLPKRARAVTRCDSAVRADNDDACICTIAVEQLVLLREDFVSALDIGSSRFLGRRFVIVHLDVEDG